MTTIDRPKSVTQRAIEWLETQPVKASYEGCFFTLRHTPTNVSVSRLHYDDAAIDLFNLVGRERRAL